MEALIGVKAMKKPTVEVYKVVALRFGGYRSSSVTARGIVEYHKDKIVKSPMFARRYGYGLCVFENLECARSFKHHLMGYFDCTKYEIWKVKGTGLKTFIELPPRLYRVGKPGEEYRTWPGWPAGTQMVDSLVYLETVEEKDEHVRTTEP